MDKIFDPEVQKYLTSLGIDQKEISRIKYEEYKKAILSILEEVSKAVEREDLQHLETLISESPAGDDMGADNEFINFSEIDGDTRPEGVDIVEALKKLRRYRNNE